MIPSIFKGSVLSIATNTLSSISTFACAVNAHLIFCANTIGVCAMIFISLNDLRRFLPQKRKNNNGTKTMKYDLSDERKVIKERIDKFRAYCKEFGHDVTIRTQKGYLSMYCGDTHFEITKTQYITSMGIPDANRDQYLLLVTNDDGMRILDAISISFSTLFDFAVKEIMENVLNVKKQYEDHLIRELLNV